MKIYLEELKGKYYGTVIRYQVSPEDTEKSIEVWDMGDYTPSRRQLEYWGLSLDEAKEDGIMCDSHYETLRSYDIACVIVDALLHSNIQ